MTTTTPDIEKKPQYQKRLREILKISARVFAEEGYEKASIRKIAAELGKSLSALYYYVQTKEELLYLIQLETFSSLADELNKLVEKNDDPIQRLHLMVENHLSHFLKHIDELKVCAHEMETLTGNHYIQVLVVRRRYFRTTRSIVTDILRQYGNADLDVNLATLNLFGMLNWIYMWYDPDLNSSAEELTNQIFRLFLNGLRMNKT